MLLNRLHRVHNVTDAHLFVDGRHTRRNRKPVPSAYFRKTKVSKKGKPWRATVELYTLHNEVGTWLLLVVRGGPFHCTHKNCQTL